MKTLIYLITIVLLSGATTYVEQVQTPKPIIVDPVRPKPPIARD